MTEYGPRRSRPETESPGPRLPGEAAARLAASTLAATTLAATALVPIAFPATALAASRDDPEPAATGGGLPPLVLIGGGKDDPDLMRRAIARAGGRAARIAILPLASRDPPRSGAAYLDFLRDLATGSRAVQIASAPAAADPAVVAALASSNLLFFTGGDQSRIVTRLRFTPALGAIGEAVRRGAVLAGTSAGAMPWGSMYIAGGTSVEAIERPSALDLRPGLALAGALLVDTHFTSRGRLGRLLVAMAARPGGLALGIDEGTAAMVDGGGITIAGAGGVAVVDASGLTSAIRQPFSAGPFTMHRLTAGLSTPQIGRAHV